MNRDKQTGIRYGIIPAHAVGQAWYDAGEPDYGEPHCPKCGKEVKEALKLGPLGLFSSSLPKYRQNYERYRKHGCDDYACDSCKLLFDGEHAFSDSDEPCCIRYEADGYAMNENSSGDLWIFRSPYFTYAQFCSPCAPGACHLRNSLEEPSEPNKCYCLGHDWFEEGKAPYAVYSVETGQEVAP